MKRKNGHGSRTEDMTIRELASTLTEKLDEVTVRFDEKLDELKSELKTELSAGFAHLGDKIDSLERGSAGIGRIVQLEERVEKLERRLETPSER